jgi:hypothetical protein
MRSLRENELAILTMIKIDADSLYERVVEREKEYMRIFSVKRTREHFHEVFKTRFWDIHPTDLKVCSPEVLIQLDAFYSQSDKLHWYLRSTEDMPGMIEDKIAPKIRGIKEAYEMLKLYLNAQFSSTEEADDPPTNLDLVSNE